MKIKFHVTQRLLRSNKYALISLLLRTGLMQSIAHRRELDAEIGGFK